ncbi:MAG TPA: hypothetical protein VNC39_12400 [Acidocella sp.]|uniref:hypothetical protein n=1 Tax=Acidocella sp. TaxID=50710 RepID=UPI002C6E3D66|nr:hypothetical protein [Acidocella sp.]HVE22769.1 hypothetical protein [Acidocella sp.]
MKKSGAKNFYDAGLWAMPLTTPMPQHKKKFLRRFFQKAASFFTLTNHVPS